MANPIQAKRILIADDDILVVDDLRYTLEKLGCIVIGEASNGQQAVELASALRPDVILMDIAMPRLDGLQATQQIQASCPTPIVLLTAHESPTLVQQAAAVGAGAYLIKPPRPNDIERAIAIAGARFADLQELRRLNAKLEWLVRDSYHRVKNNLMVIEILLGMQGEEIHYEPARAAFQSSQTRIRAMMLIHEQLHHSRDLQQVDFSSYMSRLTQALFEAYRTQPIPIDFVVDVEDIFLGADKALSCGLLLNELISNAFKHAFRGRTAGRLLVQMRQEGSQYTLIVSDDGVGMPLGDNWRNKGSLGALIVQAQVQNLNGAIELERAGGTTWKISFGEEA